MKLPRSKPLPKEKAKTRWEKFAEERGIQKKKRSRLVYDDISKDWVPRWGYKSIKHRQAAMDVIREVKGNATDAEANENPWEKDRAEKKLTQAKQKMREMRNKVEAAGFKLEAPKLD